MVTNFDAKQAALDLAGRGLAVFPCKPKSKQPACPHGCNDGTTDPDRIGELFGSRKGLNIGIATGPVSGCWVLDVEASGLGDLERLEQQHGKLPETVTAISGGGGRHYFFTYNGIEIRNKTDVHGLEIDVRGIGGYVVCPPSLHASGNRYEWLNDPGSTSMATAPDWLVQFVTGGDGLPTVTPLPPATAIEVDEDPVDLPPIAPLSPSLSFTIGGGPVEDLATAPGAPEGKRHADALRLIGSAIGRNVSLSEVAQQAVDWAKRCSPPMDQDEVLKIVSDLSRSQTIKVDTTAQAAVESVVIPEPVAWPTIESDAMQGLVGEIVEAIIPQTEADPVAILVQLLVSIGNIVGRSPRFNVEGTTHHTNLYAVLVGATARGRKGTSEGRVRQLIRLVDDEWVLGNIKNGLTSGEGVIWAVRDPIYKTEQIKERGVFVRIEEVLSDFGIEDKRLLVVEPEFAAVLRVCRRETNTLSPTIRSAWDTGILRTLAKNSPAKATDAHLSIVGHITQEELRRALCEVDGFNGFANRFLWLCVKRSKLLPDGGADLDLSDYGNRLSEKINQARSIERMRRDREATALWHQIYVDLANDDAIGLLGAVTSRGEAQVLRLSMVYALIDGSAIIQERHLRAALAVWRYCQQSARLIFGDAGGDPLENTILATIRQHDGIGRWDLHKATCKHKPADVFVKALTRLRDAGKIESRTTTTAGRSAETWFATNKGRELRELRVDKGPLSVVSGSSQGLTSLTSHISQGTDGFEEVVI